MPVSGGWTLTRASSYSTYVGVVARGVAQRGVIHSVFPVAANIAPCGMCRQALNEFEGRINKPIRLMLGGIEGKVYVIKSASQLLPLAFDREELR